MVLTFTSYIFSAYKKVEVVEGFSTACGFSVTLDIFEDSLKFLGLDYSNRCRRCTEIP